MEPKKNILLWPFSLVYGLITIVRNFLFETGILRSVEFKMPVICVGNITVGGTGKTPHVEYLSDLLRKEFSVAVLSRGYKRKTKDFEIARHDSTIDIIGDEPLQIARKFPDITVAVDRDRVHGVNQILSLKPETQVVILDDGFQHRSIVPGFSILLTDYNRLIINDNLLPYGRLREKISGMRRADVIIVTKTPGNISPMSRRLIIKDIDKAPYQNLFFTSIKYLEARPVFPDISPEESFTLSPEKRLDVVVVTGIANPVPLLDYLDKYCASINHICFPDHYMFEDEDLDKITNAFNSLSGEGKYILTTEKDAARLREFTNIADSFKRAFWYIPVGIDFLNEEKKEFDNLILDYVRKNKRNNRLSEI